MSTDTDIENETPENSPAAKKAAPKTIEELNDWLDERVDYARQVAKSSETVPVAADEADLLSMLAEALATFSQTDTGQVRAPRLVAGPGLGKSALITDPEFLAKLLDNAGLVEQGQPYRLITFDGTTTNRSTLVEYVPEYDPEGKPTLGGTSHYRIRPYINQQLMPAADDIPTVILYDDLSQTNDDRALALQRTMITKGKIDEHDIAENVNLVATLVTDNDNLEHTGQMSTIETNRRFIDVRLTIETLARTQAQRLIDIYGMSEENAVAAVVAIIEAHDYARNAGGAGEVIAEHLNWRTLEQGLKAASLGFDLNQRQVWAKQNRRSQFATAMITLPNGSTINVLADTWSKIQQIASKDGLAGRHEKEIKETYDKYCRFVGGPPLTRLEEAVFRSIEAHESLAVGTLPGEGKDFAVKSVCEFFGYEQVDLSGPSLTEHSLATSLPDSATGVMRQEFYTRIIDAEQSGRPWVLQLDETQSVPPEVLPLYNEVIYKHSLAGTKLNNLIAVVSTFNPREMNLGNGMREVQENASAPKVTTATRITTHLGPATESQMVKDVELLFDRTGPDGYSVLAEMAIEALKQRFGTSFDAVMADKQVANQFQAQTAQLVMAIKTWYMGLGKGKQKIDRIGITPGQIDSIVKQTLTKLFGSFYNSWRVENSKSAVGWATKPLDLRLGQYRTSAGKALIPGGALDKLNQVLQAALEGLGPKPRFADVLKNPGEVRRILQGLVPSDGPSETVAELMDYVNLALEEDPARELADVLPQLSMLMSAATLHPIVKETCGSILTSETKMPDADEGEERQKQMDVWARTIKSAPAIALSGAAGVNLTINPTTHDEYVAALAGFGDDTIQDDVEELKQQAALLTYTFVHPLVSPIPWNADMATDKKIVDEGIQYAVTNWAKAVVNDGPELKITKIHSSLEPDDKTPLEIQQVQQDIKSIIGHVVGDGGEKVVEASEILRVYWVRETGVDENGNTVTTPPATLDYNLETIAYVESQMDYMLQLAEQTVKEELARQKRTKKNVDKDGREI